MWNACGQTTEQAWDTGYKEKHSKMESGKPIGKCL